MGGANLNWTATNTANWLTLSITGGTLAPGAGTNVTVSLNANANSLAAGSYSDTVSFTNTQRNGSTTGRQPDRDQRNPDALGVSGLRAEFRRAVAGRSAPPAKLTDSPTPALPL